MVRPSMLPSTRQPTPDPRRFVFQLGLERFVEAIGDVGHGDGHRGHDHLTIGKALPHSFEAGVGRRDVLGHVLGVADHGLLEVVLHGVRGVALKAIDLFLREARPPTEGDGVVHQRFGTRAPMDGGIN